MGLGPIQAIYQAHVMKYQQSRGLVDHGDDMVNRWLKHGAILRCMKWFREKQNASP